MINGQKHEAFPLSSGKSKDVPFHDSFSIFYSKSLLMQQGTKINKTNTDWVEKNESSLNKMWTNILYVHLTKENRHYAYKYTE